MQPETSKNGAKGSKGQAVAAPGSSQKAAGNLAPIGYTGKPPDMRTGAGAKELSDEEKVVKILQDFRTKWTSLLGRILEVAGVKLPGKGAEGAHLNDVWAACDNKMLGLTDAKFEHVGMFEEVYSFMSETAKSVAGQIIAGCGGDNDKRSALLEKALGLSDRYERDLSMCIIFELMQADVERGGYAPFAKNITQTTDVSTARIIALRSKMVSDAGLPWNSEDAFPRTESLVDVCLAMSGTRSSVKTRQEIEADRSAVASIVENAVKSIISDLRSIFAEGIPTHARMMLLKYTYKKLLMNSRDLAEEFAKAVRGEFGIDLDQPDEIGESAAYSELQRLLKRRSRIGKR